ncbi:MAG: hypothetical protein AAF552_12500 [Pseudomonadota bacterium]
MLTIVRFFESDEAAQSAITSLTELAFLAEDITMLSPGAGEISALLGKAIKAGALPATYRAACADALAHGHSVVVMEPPFGRGDLANRVMANAGGVETEMHREYTSYDPSPLSDFLGIPALARSKRSFNVRELSNFSLSGSVGFGLSSNNATPLSSMMGLKPLTTPKPGRTSSFGMPLLSRGKTTLSSMIGLKPLTTPKPNRRSSFGLPLLSNNQTPLSSMFNFPVLAERTS